MEFMLKTTTRYEGELDSDVCSVGASSAFTPPDLGWNIILRCYLTDVFHEL